MGGIVFMIYKLLAQYYGEKSSIFAGCLGHSLTTFIIVTVKTAIVSH